MCIVKYCVIKGFVSLTINILLLLSLNLAPALLAAPHRTEREKDRTMTEEEGYSMATSVTIHNIHVFVTY